MASQIDTERVVRSVLFINRVYPPDEGATGQLLAELAEALSHDGWKVTIVAAQSQRISAPRRIEGVSHNPAVHRVGSLPFTRASHWKRALAYASLYPALLWRAWRLPRHDVVVTLTDPPLVAVLGPCIRLIKRSRLVHWAQDLYPEVAEELGVLRKDWWLAQCLRRCSTWALRRHDSVIVVGRCMQERVQARGVSPEKTAVIPNWAVGRSTASRMTQHGSRAPFTVMYSGNFGLAHPFEAVVEAVKTLARECADIHFVFAGAGPRLNDLREELAQCTNTEFRDFAPVARLGESLASADVHLVCMSRALCGLVVPSKIYGALAAGRPCIFLGPLESEAAQILQHSHRGIVLPPENSEKALADRLRQWSTWDSEYRALRAQCERMASVAAGIPFDLFAARLAPFSDNPNAPEDIRP